MKGPKSHPLNSGFTLLELMVVMALVAVVLGLSGPRLREALLTDTLTSSVRQMIGVLGNMRNEAAWEREGRTLHMNLGSGQIWATWPSLSPEEQDQALRKGLQLPGKVTILSVWIQGEGRISQGEARIHFSARGYTRPATIHLGSADGRQFTMALSPFLPSIQVHEGYVDLAGGRS